MRRHLETAMNLTPASKAETISLITRRLIPFLMLLYLVAYLDRANISVAALQMNADLGLTSRMYGLGAGLFYVTYILFEVPSNVILARVGARRWIARIMVTWGIVACGMAFIQTPKQLYGMRLLLGMAEAGFTPGIIYYISCWFPSSDRARAMSFLYRGGLGFGDRSAFVWCLVKYAWGPRICRLALALLCRRHSCRVARVCCTQASSGQRAGCQMALATPRRMVGQDDCGRISAGPRWRFGGMAAGFF